MVELTAQPTWDLYVGRAPLRQQASGAFVVLRTVLGIDTPTVDGYD
ncbi:MAG: hypothetical protein MUQ10_12255 [Anaerolineae bacterium]|nr:hypothetical protein [Anaerolineae bacterium]